MWIVSILACLLIGSDPAGYIDVCDDAGAGGYEAFPDVCRLTDGRLLCVFYAGYEHVSLPYEKHPKGGAVAACTSTDEGATWSPPTIIYDSPYDDRDPSVVLLPNGSILCNLFSLDRPTGPNSALTYLPKGIRLVRSDDGGKTWVERPQPPGDFCSSPIRVLSTGRLLLGSYQETKGWSACFVSHSDDNGKSWSKLVEIPSRKSETQPPGFIDYTEPDFIERSDGSILAVQRSDRRDMAWSVSKDKGQTWSISQSIGFRGHCPYLHRAKSGVLLLAHRVPNTSLHWSKDEGKTWSDNVLIDEKTGAYPSMVDLKDGSVLFVYYEEGPGSNIRARRISATPEGVRIIQAK